ncbi:MULTISPECIES: ParB/RepB/Spo0J family partition protein [unclassified Aureimonas]|uniref:ParB/RepB/Spo0J family partition protein n=1 Tax=unclassified Aureimonas TaxID=2615206 RepID=UPI0006FE8A0B|nr:MULTISPECIES: ParB/RepB/Spo0J family partition protein [unclassified Aureimonas]KQT52654.1 chromosome partitioning protein ParB [Aureimonas sp. Leaf427]KQT77673.1 chromosome partitioning protein ParB [Aureimonas sp. Leaf460]
MSDDARNDDKSRQRLGRGLASLIGSGGIGGPVRAMGAGGGFGAEMNAGQKVAIARLSPNPRNPRRNFDESELGDLTASIKTHGVVQPILVRPKPGVPGSFEIVAGERRFRAAQKAGLSEIPVVSRDITDRESLEIAIIENVQRADLNALEEAKAYEMLIEEHGYTQADLADVLGKSRSHVANTLRLLKLPEAVRDMLSRGDISPGHARTAVSADDPEGFARRIVEGGLSVRQAEELARGPAATTEPTPRRVRGARAAPPTSAPSPAKPKDSDTQALERLLSDALGMRVEIRLPGEGGDLRIDYGTLEQLDEICRLLQARQAGSVSEPKIRSL